MPEVKNIVQTRHAVRSQYLCILTCAAVALATLTVSAWAQGPVLSVQPGNTAQGLAGTANTVGYSGDGGAATSATLASPAAVAYDKSGNLYIADANNHVIRSVSAAGIITTVAGTGVEGFGGDGGAATSAQLDTPTGVAVDASGNLYIADSHNQRIREVSRGTISTIAGNGTAGYSGDGAAATTATLFLPQAVAVDAGGNVYIADTGNFVIRKVSAGFITTVAGDGVQMYSGDGGPATSAGLDTPTGVAVDASGNLYIADSHNQRIREVSGGVINTIAGNGTLGYGGDSGAATSATLAKPRGVSVDASGNVYIADTENNVLRQVSNGFINTLVGTGQQGYSGDGGAAISAVLNTPRAVAPDALGNVAFADSSNQLVREVALPLLGFGNQAVGSVSAAKSLTISNTGSASMQVQSLTFTGGFGLASGGSCGATPITVAAGSSCTVQVAFAPTLAGVVRGSVVINGAGLNPQTVLLVGTGTAGLDALTLSGTAAAFYGGTMSFTATLTSGSQMATGTVTFFAGTTTLATVALTNDSATMSAAALLPGTYSITASYSGDTNYPAVTSAPFTLIVGQATSTTILNVVSSGVTCGAGLGTLTATVTVPAGIPTGMVAFYNGSAQLGTATLNSAGQASLTPSLQQLSAGIQTLTAVYADDPNFTGSTSVPTMNNSGVSGLQGGDYSLGVANGGSSTVTAVPGGTAILELLIAPLNRGTLAGPVTLGVVGLPSGASCSLTPSVIAAGDGATTANLAIQIPLHTAAKSRRQSHGFGGGIAFGLLLLPLLAGGAARKRAVTLRRFLLLCVITGGAVFASVGLNGCAGGTLTNGSAAPQSTTSILVTGVSGSVLHTQQIQLEVQ